MVYITLWIGYVIDGQVKRKVWEISLLLSPNSLFPLSTPLRVRAEIQSLVDQYCLENGVTELIQLHSLSVCRMINTHFRTASDLPNYLQRRLSYVFSRGPDHPFYPEV